MPKITLHIDYGLKKVGEGDVFDISLDRVQAVSNKPPSDTVFLPLLLMMTGQIVDRMSMRKDYPEELDETISKVQNFLKYLFVDSTMTMKK
jgi:hypothetical protein